MLKRQSQLDYYSIEMAVTGEETESGERERCVCMCVFYEGKVSDANVYMLCAFMKFCILSFGK